MSPVLTEVVIFCTSETALTVGSFLDKARVGGKGWKRSRMRMRNDGIEMNESMVGSIVGSVNRKEVEVQLVAVWKREG